MLAASSPFLIVSASKRRDEGNLGIRESVARKSFHSFPEWIISEEWMGTNVKQDGAPLAPKCEAFPGAFHRRRRPGNNGHGLAN